MKSLAIFFSLLFSIVFLSGCLCPPVGYYERVRVYRPVVTTRTVILERRVYSDGIYWRNPRYYDRGYYREIPPPEFYGR